MNDLRTEQPARALPISVGAVSEIGQREQNQDCMTGFTSPFGTVYLIADGMGGHRGGAEASRMVAEAFNRHLLAAPASSPMRDAVVLALRLTNIEILEKGKSGNPEFEGMGSTVVIALVGQSTNGLELTTSHVGDSRIYLQRDGKLTLLTKDHTQVQWLIDNHALDEAAARTHPDASVLTRAMGHTTDLQVDISDPIPLREGDGILLCSDGLSGFANAEDIDRTIRENPDPSTCANQLVQLALASGSNDNITVQFLRIGRDGSTIPRGRVRETQPDGPKALPAASTTSSWRLISVAAVIVLAVALGWIYFHRKPTIIVDPAIAKLAQRAKTFQADSTKLHDDAKACQEIAAKDLVELEKLGSDAGKPANLRNELKDLKAKLPVLQNKFGDIVAASSDLEQDARSHSTELDELERPASQNSKPLSARLNSLTKVVGQSETDLKSSQTDLAKAKQTQAELKDRETKLQADWKAAPQVAQPPAHTETRKPPPQTSKPPAGKPSNGPKGDGSGDDENN
jgi:serine/threonine protein phosphatase PrpC